MAAGVIRLQTRDGFLSTTLRNVAIDIAKFAPEAPPLPESFEELCEIVEQVEGVHFRELFERLPRVAPDGDAAMQMVIELAKQVADQRKAEDEGEQEAGGPAPDA